MTTELSNVSYIVEKASDLIQRNIGDRVSIGNFPSAPIGILRGKEDLPTARDDSIMLCHVCIQDHGIKSYLFDSKGVIDLDSPTRGGMVSPGIFVGYSGGGPF